MLDDEQLVRTLEQLVHRGAHRALDDRDKVERVELKGRSDVQRAAAALVVRRQRDELEDALDVRFGEARLEQALGRTRADETLCARAGVDAGGFDSDDAPDTAARRCGDSDERDQLLRSQARNGCRPGDGKPRMDLHLRPQRVLPLEDATRDVLGEGLDEEGLSAHERHNDFRARVY